MKLIEKAKESPLASLSAVMGLLITFGGAVFAVEDRYAHADSLVSVEYRVQQMEQTYEQKTDNILSMMILQAQTRKTILEMKQAQGGLSPEETVELNSLKGQLQALEGDNND